MSNLSTITPRTISNSDLAFRFTVYDEESKPLTTFITEWRCYRYLRAPMGLTSSGDEFCARTDKALAGIPGVFKLVDDILMFGDSVEQLLDRVKAIF